MGGLLSNQTDSDYLESSSYSEDDEESYTSNSEENNMKPDTDNAIRDISGALDDICLDSATDAVSAEPSTSTRVSLNLKQIWDAEDELDLYEKVSLVYLLYEDSREAYKDLNGMIRGRGDEKLLYKWANQQKMTPQNNQKWQEKFVEALTIIQNYQILKRFGYEKKDVDEIFLPQHSFTSLYVHKTRKTLYHLCEDLTQSETEDLLKFVISDLKERGLDFKIFNSAYLEIYLLHWEEVGYIKLDNLSNLCGILKQLEQFDWCDRLKTVAPAVIASQLPHRLISDKNVTSHRDKTVDVDAKKSRKSGKIFESLLNETPLETLMTLESSSISSDNASSRKDSDTYDIDPGNPGVCLIINQEDFYTEIDSRFKNLLSQTKLESRQGTQKDKRDLEATFRMFNFKTEVVDNLTHTEITEKIREVIIKMRHESSLFVCVMSHGDEGVIYGVNSCQVRVRQIQEMMCSLNQTNLIGKPKILILQSCQGTRCQKISSFDEEDDVTTDGPSSSKPKIVPPRADLFTFWATLPGYGAIRDKRTGSWFIQSICEKMKRLGNQYHFEDICTAVIADVSSKIWCQKSENVVAMVPLKDSTFRKKFFLPPVQRL